MSSYEPISNLPSAITPLTGTELVLVDQLQDGVLTTCTTSASSVANLANNSAVVSVIATLPLSSTGGRSPNISISQPLTLDLIPNIPYSHIINTPTIPTVPSLPLSVINGGTGNSNPGLINGANINITGNWPNQVISTTLPSNPVVSVTAYSPLSSTGGTNPIISITANPSFTTLTTTAGITSGNNNFTVDNSGNVNAIAGTFTGQINLINSGSNFIVFNAAGLAPPSYTTRSIGTKIVLYPDIGSSTVDCGIGLSNNGLWNSVPNSSFGFAWYAGATSIATLNGIGGLSLNGGIAVGSSGLMLNGYSSPTASFPMALGNTSSTALNIVGYSSSSTLSILANGGSQYMPISGGVYSTNSDISFKKEIVDTKYGLETIKKLQPRNYKLKHNNKPEIGFIAQEFKNIVPELVNESEAIEGTLGINYSGIIPILVKAIQELTEEVELLRKNNK